MTMTASARRFRPTLGVLKTNVPKLLARAQSIYDGMNADKVTYASPNPALPAFLIQIQTVTTAEQLVKTRIVGAAATRDSERDVLYVSMETQCVYGKGLVELAPPGRALALIQNAGLVAAGFPGRTKALLTLTLGKASGTVIATANVGLLVAASQSLKPYGMRFFNWSATFDGGKTIVALPPTNKGTTTLTNLTPLTTVGVRVNLNIDDAPGEWSQMVTI